MDCFIHKKSLKPFRLSVTTVGENGLPLNALTAVCLRLQVMQNDGKMWPTSNPSEMKRSLSMTPGHTNILLVLQKKSKKWGCVKQALQRAVNEACVPTVV